MDYGELLFHYDFNRDTLLRAHRLALDHINSQNGNTVSLDQLAQAHDSAIRDYLAARRIDYAEWPMDRIMADMLEALNPPAHVSIAGMEEIYVQNDHDVRPMDTTLESLPQIAEMGRLGIISNLPHNSLIRELAQYDCLKWFDQDAITISYQAGHRKPHPRIYQMAMQRAQVNPEQSTFISHDEEEVVGATEVCMHSFLATNLGEALSVLQSQ